MLTKPAFEDITVTVVKEGDRSVQKLIPVRIHLSHAQSGWVPFLNRVKRELELEDIDGIYEDFGGAPVVRIASLIDGGLYFARPTEVCAMLRSLAGQGAERYPAWPSIEEGVEAKRELERLRVYYQSLPLSSTAKSKVTTPAVVESGDIGGVSAWMMRVKQGFKCRVYGTPECTSDKETGVLAMCTVITLSSDWGAAMEKHPLRGKREKGNVFWMTSPQEGFVQRRPLEDMPRSDVGGQTIEAAAPVVFTAVERMEVIRTAASFSEILRTTLRRGAFFEGATGVHDTVEVHRSALRAGATLMRTDAASREELLDSGGLDLFILIVTRFVEDVFVCEYGCWALTAFSGGGDAEPDDFRFQVAVAEAGGLTALRDMTEAHPDKSSLWRHCLGSLAAIVDQNASTSAQFFAINLHETVAVVAITRWPNNAELCCLACWVLRSILPATVSTGLPEVSDGDDLGSHHDDENTCPGYRDGGSGARTDRTQEDNCDGGDAEEGFLERLLRLAQETRVRHHDNEDTRKAASALVLELVDRIGGTSTAFISITKDVASGAGGKVIVDGNNATRHAIAVENWGVGGDDRPQREGRRRVNSKKVARLLREGHALGAL